MGKTANIVAAGAQQGPAAAVKKAAEIKPPATAAPEVEKHVTFAPPMFVKHLNKTRTMSAKQKWDWAFDKILQVGLKTFLVNRTIRGRTTPSTHFKSTYSTTDHYHRDHIIFIYIHAIYMLYKWYIIL